MPFSLDTWRAQFKSGLASWKQRIIERKIDSLYGGLAATALWPVIAAFQQGDNAALFAFGQMLSSVATNLLANGIQKWRDEDEVARELNARVMQEPALREEVDALLSKLEAIKLAHEELPEAQRQWFVDTLRSELQALGNVQKYENVLNSVIVGGDMTGGVNVSGGTVHIEGDVVGRDKITTHNFGTVQGNVYYGPTPQDPETALKIYCRVLRDTCRHLPLRGIDVGASDPTSGQQRLELAQVYVNLDTTTHVEALLDQNKKSKSPKPQRGEEEKTRPLGVLEATIQNRRLVITGDPGSGKSTFFNFLALCLAAQQCEPESKWLARLSNWPEKETDLVPVMVVLRDFARWLPSAIKKAEPRLLWDFICERLAAQNLSFVKEALHHKLEQGQALVLLDGLDEIPSDAQRKLMREAITAFARRYATARVLVTCRTLSYQDPAWQLPGVPAFELAPLAKEKIFAFIKAWYAELGRVGLVKAQEAETLAQRLQASLQRPDLKRLAPNPLLLTVMALVHTHKGRLPDSRVLLYEETVDMLLWRWEQLKNEGDNEAPTLRRLLQEAGRSDVDLKRALWRLAFSAHDEGGANEGKALADIGELRLEKALAELHPQNSRDWARHMIEALKLRAGLLLEREREVYTFPHRTFQEYLAGAQLSTQEKFAQQAMLLFTAKPYWREAILLAVGRLVNVNGESDRPLALVGELCPQELIDDEAAWRKGSFAGEVLLEMGLPRVNEGNLGKRLLHDVRQRLVALLRHSALPPVERARAGDVLGRLGDPRFRADAWYLPDEPMLGFIEIPGGKFLLGSNKKVDREALNDELPQHELTLPTFYLSRYPVTVAQFRVFVEESGRRPEHEESLQGVPNHPVVHVTWYDALAYCEWLTERLRAWPHTPEPLASLIKQKAWRIILPSEAEWEKAARGADGRIYPWNDKIDRSRANYDKTNINSTSAMGCFPLGASPYGCEDMSGNVREWTRSLRGDYPYPEAQEKRRAREELSASQDSARVLRGGAFPSDDGGVRCAYRDYSDPDCRNYDLGFRVAALPLL